MSRKKHKWLQPKPYLWVRLHVGRVEYNHDRQCWLAIEAHDGVRVLHDKEFDTAFAARQHLDYVVGV